MKINELTVYFGTIVTNTIIIISVGIIVIKSIILIIILSIIPP